MSITSVINIFSRLHNNEKGKFYLADDEHISKCFG